MKQSAFQRKLIVCAAIAALGVSAIGVRMAMAADKDSDIVVIMKKGFKSTKTKASILKKATDGTATKDELTTLLGYAKDLQKAKPPQGEQKSWDAKTASLVTATEGLIKGDASAAASMKSAANCKECHKLHKPD